MLIKCMVWERSYIATLSSSFTDQAHINFKYYTILLNIIKSFYQHTTILFLPKLEKLNRSEEQLPERLAVLLETPRISQHCDIMGGSQSGLHDAERR